MAMGCIGPDIRRRPSRPITGKSACAPSWDGIRRVLDKGEELQSFSSSPYELWHQLSPEERSHECVRCARGREVNSRSGDSHSQEWSPFFSSRSLVGYCLFPIIVPFFCSPFTPHHMSSVISCTRCLNEYSAIDYVPAGRSRITRRVSGSLGWDQAHLGGN